MYVVTSRVRLPLFAAYYAKAIPCEPPAWLEPELTLVLTWEGVHGPRENY